MIPRRTIPSTTLVPLGPRNRRMISSFDIFTPAMAVSLTETMRSPATIPTFSDGPPVTGWMTRRVSSTILNCTPMPSKLPDSGSLRAFTSLGVEYDECGSSFSSMPRMASSTSFPSSTLSTYRLLMASSAICNFLKGLSSPKFSFIWAMTDIVVISIMAIIVALVFILLYPQIFTVFSSHIFPQTIFVHRLSQTFFCPQIITD